MSKLFQNYKRAQIEFVKAEGNVLIDTEGKRYLDFSSGIGVTNLGFHPYVEAALQQQADQIWHTPNIYLNQLQEEVAEKLMDDKDYLAFFCNSGAEANEAAIKLARKATGKQEIITFKQSFHGRTFGSMSATGQDKIKHGFGDGVPHFKYAAFNDLESVKQLITTDTAAIMLELIQGESGIIIADQAFVQGLVQLCKDKNILLIVDEVQTGMGRTGKLFAFEHYHIEPDIYTLAKGLGNGVPVGAMLGKAELGSAFDYGSHGSTFGGNKLAMAASSATLNVMKSPDFLENSFKKGECLKTQLQEKLKDKASVIEVRGLGHMIGIETTQPLNKAVENARSKGLIVLTAGTNVIRLLPPLTLSKEEIDQGIHILVDVLT
ncbi:acetylornithine transaminase [Staphylococcus simulans]|uniref:acetylornithine transaminase n=1 Tax=Staphylococcus simulans TaxID=1286 RepID=UPI001E532444|nr:acetylornithine transaminase [Staphylococcus simulans]MCD8915383.1 acetylornithine transaminase [Staphylococcus simulans]